MTEKSGLRTAAKMLLLIFLSAAIGATLLILSCQIPASWTDGNLRESVPVFQREGTYPNLNGWGGAPNQESWNHKTMDNFTDAIMLLTAGYDGGESATERAMSGYYALAPERNPAESLAVHYDESVPQYTTPYARYWGGWQIYLRPLLCVMNYSQMRVWNLALQAAATAFLLFLLYKKGLGRYILPMLFVPALLTLRVTASSLTFSDVFYLYTGGCCVLLLRYEKWKGTAKPLYFFLTLGILTAYFDFLTYPLVSFGIPVCLWFCIEDGSELLGQLKSFVLFGLSWGAGYGGMWASKWVLGSLLTGRNVLAEAASSVQYRSSSNVDGQAIGLLETVVRNAVVLLHDPWFLLFWAFCILLLALLVQRDRLGRLRDGLILLCAAALPFVWYAVLKNHSYVHFWFTYRELAIFAFALSCFLLKAVGELRFRPGQRRGGAETEGGDAS